jgi:hypothetical protein
MTDVTRYIVGPFIAYDANLAPGDFVAGVPSPFAALGLAGAIARKAKLDGWAIAAIPVIHKIELSPGRLRAAPEAKSNKLKSIEVVETVTGQIEFSLLLEFPDYVSSSVVTKYMKAARFSGGSCFPLGTRALGDCVREIEGDDLPRALRGIPRGYAITPPLPERENCAIISYGDRDSLENVISTAFPGNKKKGSGMLIPCPVGYRLCEDPHTAEVRKGGRDQSTPHVFVDQALGVAELISIRNRAHFSTTENAFKTLSWRWAQDDSARFAFFSPYHLEASGLSTTTIAS